MAPDWPGLSRGAKNEQAAIERLQAYLPRYALVARLAGMESDFDLNTTIDVVERYPGTGSTDFWGISFAFSSIDRQTMSEAELEREMALMQAAWAYFDEVRARVSPELQKGPRGGGRNRDQIVGHVIGSEQNFTKKVGLPPLEAVPTGEELQTYRNSYTQAIRDFHAHGKTARTWPLRYLIRHTAFHTLDHTWEMEDKNLTPTNPDPKPCSQLPPSTSS